MVVITIRSFCCINVSDVCSRKAYCLWVVCYRIARLRSNLLQQVLWNEQQVSLLLSLQIDFLSANENSETALHKTFCAVARIFFSKMVTTFAIISFFRLCAVIFYAWCWDLGLETDLPTSLQRLQTYWRRQHLAHNYLIWFSMAFDLHRAVIQTRLPLNLTKFECSMHNGSFMSQLDVSFVLRWARSCFSSSSSRTGRKLHTVNVIEIML